MQINSDFYVKVWQKEHATKAGNTVLVAMFVLESDAARWVEENNKTVDGELYYWTSAKKN